MLEPRYPDFLIIGAARSATTSLARYLGQCPDIFLSSVKEPNYFAIADSDVSPHGPGEDDLGWITALDEYLALFLDAPPGSIAGEASTLYLYSESAPRRIHRNVPGINLVAILRNPVERAYSAYSYLRERGAEPCTDFLQALWAERERIAAGWSHIWHYAAMGFYHRQLQRYRELFDADQLHVVVYDDFARDPAATVRAALRFLGADPDFTPNVGIRHNVSGEARVRLLAPLLGSNAVMRRVRPLALRLFPDQVSHVKQRLIEKPPIPEDAAGYLRELYADDVSGLSGMLGRDLRFWLQAPESRSRPAQL
jgi:hypothetical protein